MPICDTLLRLADVRLFRPVWSDAILDELTSSLERRGVPADRATRRREVLESTFPEADEPKWRDYVALVPNEVDTGDRHVVATALAAAAQVIVTDNLKHFPGESLARFDIAVQRPDEFLVHQLGLAPEAVIQCLREQAAALTKPAVTFEELVGRLERATPGFVAEVRLLLEAEDARSDLPSGSQFGG